MILANSCCFINSVSIAVFIFTSTSCLAVEIDRTFIAGLIPLMLATGAGAIGNRTLGSAALGGMLFGTVFGVIIVPGLYYIFGTLAEGRKLIKGEEFNPLSEDFNYYTTNQDEEDETK